MKKFMCLVALSSLTTFAAPLEVRDFMISGNSEVSQELAFVAKQQQFVKLSVISPGIGDASLVAEDATVPGVAKRFAFGSAGATPGAENFGIVLSDKTEAQYQAEACGEDETDADSIIHHKLDSGDETWISSADAGINTTLLDADYSCSVNTALAGKEVTQRSAHHIMVEAGGGAVIDVQVNLINGVDADLSTPNSAKAFKKMGVATMSTTGGSPILNDTNPSADFNGLGHGSKVSLNQDIVFDLIGSFSKAESRAVIEIVGTLSI